MHFVFRGVNEGLYGHWAHQPGLPVIKFHFTTVFRVTLGGYPSDAGGKNTRNLKLKLCFKVLIGLCYN